MRSSATEMAALSQVIQETKRQQKLAITPHRYFRITTYAQPTTELTTELAGKSLCHFPEVGRWRRCTCCEQRAPRFRRLIFHRENSVAETRENRVIYSKRNSRRDTSSSEHFIFIDFSLNLFLSFSGKKLIFSLGRFCRWFSDDGNFFRRLKTFLDILNHMFSFLILFFQQGRHDSLILFTNLRSANAKVLHASD